MTPPAGDKLDHTMSFGEHLEELRRRILLALLVPIPAAIGLFFISGTLIKYLLLPLYDVLRAQGLPPKLLNLAPQEMVLLQLKLSLVFGLILSAPWVFWQAWKFISPGLYQHERRFVQFLIPGSAILTFAGLALMYFVMLPLTLNVLVAMSTNVEIPPAAEADTPDPRIKSALEGVIEFKEVNKLPPSPAPGDAVKIWGTERRYLAVPTEQGGAEWLEVPRPPAPNTIAQEYRVSETIGFILLMFLGIAIAFQMPLVVVLLGWLGLATADWFRARRKYALFLCGVIAAVVTPSADLVSMFVMMLPLYGLFELGILLLVIAPASAVAEGRVFSINRWRGGRSDKAPGSIDQPRKAAQTDLAVARGSSSTRPPPIPGAHWTDGGEDRP